MERDTGICAPIGASLVVMRRPGRRFFVLNPSAVVAWQALSATPPGGEPAAIASAFEHAFGLAPAHARQEADGLVASWRAAGLLDGDLPATGDVEESWVIPPPPPVPLGPGQLSVEVSGLGMALEVHDASLRARLAGLIACLPAAANGSYRHHLRLEGGADDWTLTLNGAPHAGGETADEALAVTLGALSDLAAQAEDRLLVVHGAGVARRDGRTALLVAPSGHGKTTLAAALNAGSLALLSDDVVPIDRAGRPLAQGMPICLKAGSWPVIRTLRPELDGCAAVMRHGEPVRFLPPVPHAVTAPLQLAALLFPAYVPGRPPAVERLAPERALQLLVESESIIRNLTQEKLADLARWVASVPAHALSYPDLASATPLVHRLLGDG